MGKEIGARLPGISPDALVHLPAPPPQPPLYLHISPSRFTKGKNLFDGACEWELGGRSMTQVPAKLLKGCCHAEPRQAGFFFAGKQCRERWHNQLRPDIKRDAWTEEEELSLIKVIADRLQT